MSQSVIEQLNEEQTVQRTYAANYACGNCGHVSKHHIDVGTPAPHSATCKNCGCDATKTWPGF